ncbi:unnamed protein product [[Candida] boidinii]|nr:unnamed protein product [[Candida] boidinii]
MKFIPGYQYKDTVYDKNLKKFVKTDNKTSSESKDSKHNSNDDHNTNTNNNKSDSQKVNTTEKDDMLEALNQITDVNDTTRSVVEKHSSILKKPKNVIIHRESPPEVSFFLPSNHKDSFEEELENQENESYYGKSTNKIKRNIQQDITNTSFANSDETSFRKGNASIDNTRILSDVKVADITNLDVSFSESRKALVSALTNIKPYGSWNKLEVLNLSKLGLNNLKDLDKMAPNVRNINASKNNIEYVEGIPQRVQILQISHNHISGLTSFAKYNDLQYLNLSHNKVENFRMFNELYNLRCLILKSNRIKSLRGLEDLKTLVELDISDNFLRGDLDFNNFELNFLESLNLKNNKIRSIKGLEKLKELIVLNCDHNETSSLKCNINHKNLRKLSLKLNRLTSLDLSFAVHLKELRIDGNNLREIKGLSKRLEIIEAKLQNNNDSINSLIVESCKIKKLNKLDLTGSKNTGFTIPNDFKVGLFTNISVLNLSAMNLESLPDNLGDVFPVVYDLNLNFNRLKSLKGIENMRFLVKLKVLSNNISDLKEIFDYGASFRFKLRLLDLRVNPINKSYYPYVFYKDEENGELNGTIDNLTINESDYTANNNNNNNNNNNGSTTVTPRFNNKNKRNISSIIGSSVTDILPASTPTEETRADRTSIYDESTMLHLETYEDIEAFSIEYSKLHKAQGIEEWHKRDDKHIDYLNKFTRGIRDKRRNYENSLIVWFNNISYLDGHKIESSRRHKERALFARKRKFPN